MEEENKRYDYVEDVEISKEMRTAFLDYSMSVIVSRALPDVCLLYTSPSPRDRG